jgi:hypothetical protein
MIIITIAHPTGKSSISFRTRRLKKSNKAVIEDGRSERTTVYTSSSDNNQLQAIHRRRQIGRRQQLLHMRTEAAKSHA